MNKFYFFPLADEEFLVNTSLGIKYAVIKWIQKRNKKDSFNTFLFLKLKTDLPHCIKRL